MVSLSDERIAEPSARLFYHQARSYTSEPLTVSATAELHDDLCRLESQHIDLLVDRALDADPSLVVDSDPCDRRVLELLGSRLPSRGARPPRSARGALGLLARTMQRAVRTRDRVALGTIYRELCALELPISGRLARTLRLVDTVAAPAAVADLAPRPLGASADPLSRPAGLLPRRRFHPWPWRRLDPHSPVVFAVSSARRRHPRVSSAVTCSPLARPVRVNLSPWCSRLSVRSLRPRPIG